ncbi:hypothetical protein Moror_15934 [Moniliophthora roreri MCA 2997]|uniref:Uncharacterized protein n=2 Tax=Moniliophthora roreri TaxID=221103 RepID=V2XIU3_MONRO|nr:hypothetical protein Moror_15934 [Moniliophthora roreri MCA 2997]KAI3607693.1 hypothetical protein WG66_004797 [Moniliophthora roreri]
MGPLLCLLLPIWVEAIGYGFFSCLFCATVCIYFIDWLRLVAGSPAPASRANIMLFISAVMFMIATIHLALGTYRLFKNYIDVAVPPILPVARWDNITITLLYATQEILGSGAAVYRCWILWNMDWEVVAFPLFLLLGEIAVSYVPSGFIAESDLAKGIADPRIPGFITSFYVLNSAANITTTSLMVYRLWSVHRNSHTANKSILVSVMWILVESAMLQLVVEVILLGLFLVNSSAQYVFFGLVVPVIGITFTAVALRIKLVSVANAFGEPSSSSSSSNGPQCSRRTNSSHSRRIVFTDIGTHGEDIFRTSDYYKHTHTELPSRNTA